MANREIRTEKSGKWTYKDYLNEINSKDQTSSKMDTTYGMLRVDSNSMQRDMQKQRVNTVIEVLEDKKNLESYRKEARRFKIIRNTYAFVCGMYSTILAENTILQTVPQFNPYHWVTMQLLGVEIGSALVVVVSGFMAYHANRSKKRSEREAEEYHAKSSLKDIPINRI